jgi:hypothetical protein
LSAWRRKPAVYDAFTPAIGFLRRFSSSIAVVAQKAH